MSFLKEHAISNPVVAGVSAAAPKEQGLFSTIMDNVAGGAESVIGGGLDYIGAQLKRFDEAGRESSYVDSIRNSDEGTLGKWGDSFINNGEYLNDKAAKNFAESGTLDKYQDMSIIDRLTSADYLTDKRGLLADFSQMAGSAIPFAAASAAAPFGGAGALAARGIGSTVARAGAKQIGKAIMSKAGQQAGASAAKWALGTGPLEAATNAGDMYADLKDEGLSDDEIARRMNSMIQEELPMDMLTQGIMGPILEGKGFKPIFKRGGRAGKIAGYGVNIPGSAASEYAQEMTQQQAQNKWSGKPYGTFFNPTEDEQQAGRAAFMGSLPLGLFGAGHTAYRDYKARINRMNNEAAKSNPNNPFNGMEETAGNKTEIADVPESTVTVQRGNANNGGSDKEAFFNAIEMQESGGDPDAVSSTGARGVYQIQPENWDAWSKEAGLGGASMDDDDAYRQVGRFKMGQYFDEYGPEGALVAWYSGPNNAQRWVDGEATDQNGRPWDAPQGNGPSIAGYVNSAMGHFADEKAQSPALDIPQTADYTISGEVSNPNLTDLTEQKLRLLDRDYYNQYGRHFYITSMARNGGGESWHDSAQAFDTADDFLEGNADARNWLIDKAKEYGLYGLDEYSNPSANATGGHLHFSDHGEALNGSGGSYNITVPGFNLSQYDLTPEQEKANMEAAQALISNNEVTPEQQQSVMEMATQLMNMPVSDDVNEDAAHAAAMQNAIDGGDIGAIFKMHPQETANAMMKPVMAAKAPSPRRAPATPKIDNINPQAPAQTSVSTNYGNRFAQTVDDITKLASQGKIAEAALVARSNGWNNTMVNLLTQGVNASAGNIQNAIMNGIQLDVPNAFPALPEGQGLAGNIKNNQQHISIANLEELASIANNNPQYAAAQATQQNLPTTASAIMQSAMNGQPIDSGLLDSTIQQDLNNKQKQANANRQVIDARMQKAGLATNPATPDAGIIVPNGAPAETPDIVVPDTPKRKAPTVNTNDLMARLNDSPVFRQAKAKGDIGAMANEADAMGFHKEAEQIRNSQYGNVPSKFDYKKRLSEVKKMSRADRIELGKELLNELEAKNIPVNDNLRNDLEHGVPKAIVNAEKKLANAETNDEAEQKVKPAEEATPAIANNEAAENVPEQDNQEVKAEAEKPAEEGNKKATNENNKKNEPLVSSAPESPDGALGTPTVNGSSTSNISQEQKPSKGNLEQSSSQHFDITDYTHTKTGEVYNAAKINGKVDRDTYAKIKDIATKHGGRYNRFAKRFFFKDTGADGRNAFVAEAEREVFGEETKQEEKIAATQNETVAETKVQDSNSEAENTNAENDFHGFLDGKTPSEVAKIKEVLLAKTDPFGGRNGYVTSKHIMETLARSSAKGKVKDNRYYINGNRMKKIAYEYFEYLRNKSNEKSATQGDAIKAPAKKETKAEPEKDSIFGEYNEAELYNALGIKAVEDNKSEVLPDNVPDGIEGTEEERARLREEIRKELNKISANPIFNPRLYTLSAKYVFSYMKSGLNDIKKLMTTLKAEFGNDFAKDWAPAVIETIRTYPKDIPFNESHVMAVTKSVGSLYENGTTDLDEITSKITAHMNDSAKKQFAPVIEASYNGVKKFFDVKKEADSHGVQQGQSGDADGGHQSVATGASQENEHKEAGEVSRPDGREAGRAVTNDDSKDTEKPATGGIRAGSKLETAGSTGADSGRNKPAVPLTEAQQNPSATETPGHDYEIKERSANKASAPERFKQNIKAIKLLKQLLADNRMPTPAEQKVLAEYNGWGGLKDAFREGTKENNELKELLSESEYKAAKASTLDAFYTAPSIVRAIWKGVSRLGFKGGRVLDPAMGIGNFYGCMPRDMMSKSKLYGVEMDELSSQFSKMLYPSAMVENKPFQSSKAADNFFDLVITNVPFSQAKAGGYMIHNFYFANGIDKVRPGGLMVYITSQGSLTGTTDAAKMRSYLAGRADVIGAYKLPEGAFKEAGTDVSVDVVIVRKRDKDNRQSEHAQSALEVKNFNIGYMAAPVNEYFLAHKNHIIGTKAVIGSDAYGNQVLKVKNESGQDVGKMLEKAMNDLPKDIYQPINRNNRKTYNTVDAMKRARVDDENIRDLEYYVKDGKLYQNDNGEAVPITGKNAPLIKSYVGIKSTLNSLFVAQRDPDVSDGTLDRLRGELNKRYDAFVKKYGYINDPKNVAKFAKDPSAGTIMALEKITFKGQGKKRTIESVEKADIFTERTMQAIKKVISAKNPNDALLASLNQLGHVDIDYMAKLLKIKPSQLEKALKGVIYKNPANETYETSDEYLSGNVREKLAQAEMAAEKDPAYKGNVEALKKVQPADLVTDEIIVNLGAPWIPVADVQAFVDSINAFKAGSLEIGYIPTLAKWTVSGMGRSTKFKADGITLPELLECILNNKSIQVYNGRGKDRVLDSEKTDAANVVADDIKDAFKHWLWQDKERADRLAKFYNENYNNMVLRKYDGAHLDFPGMNAKIHMKPHQKNVVWRMLQNGNTLIAHCVGAGKTFEMQAAGMEMRRLGLANKPLYCVPNNVVEQFAREFRQLYPNAKLLVVKSGSDLPTVRHPKVTTTEDGRKKVIPINLKEMTKAERDKLLKARAERNRALARIQTEDWDGIIMSHTMFERLPLSKETLTSYIQEELDMLERTVKQHKGDNLDKRTENALEARKESLKNKIDEIMNMDAKDIGIPFEEIGIDQIFVDEADMFKNLHYTTAIGNVSGLTNSNANRSMDMFVKTQYLTRLHDGRGVVFATGTPISNTMAEMYTMMRYLDSRGLKEKGVELFDSWIRTFGEIGTGIERKPSGDGFRKVNKIKNFINMAELTKMFRKFADVKRQEDLNLDIPKLKNDKPTVVALEPDPEIVRYIREVVPERVADMKKNAYKQKKGADNMLKLTGDLRKMALSDAKIEVCADKIAEVFDRTADVKGAQLVFCDLGIPKAENEKANADTDSDKLVDDGSEGDNASVYDRLMDALKRRGIPDEQIAFVQQAKNKDEQAELFQKVDRGDLRILIGSTARMGAGTNCQHHLAALHDLDAPWRPRDLEQRHGRILRQGNQNSEVEIFNYVIKDSFDANMWEKLKNKASIIAQAMSDNTNLRVVEDADIATLSYAEIEGAATGNPLIKDQLKLNNEVTKYSHASTEFNRKVHTAETQLQTLPEKVAGAEETIDRIERDIKARKSTRGNDFAIILDGKTYTKRADADKALAGINAKLDNVPKEIGSIGGFKIKASLYKVDAFSEATPMYQLVKNYSYHTQTSSIAGIENCLAKNPEKELKQLTNERDRLNMLLEEAKEIAAQKNPYTEKLAELNKKLKDINRQIETAMVDKHYSVSEGISTNRLNDALIKQEVRQAFPTGKVIGYQPDQLQLKLQNNTYVTVRIRDNINLPGTEENKARKAHGFDGEVAITVNGYTNILDYNAVIGLARNGDDGTIYHEAFHVAYNMALLDEEKTAIEEAFGDEARKAGKDVEEYAADSYREWFISRHKDEKANYNTIFEKIKGMAKSLAELLERIVNGNSEVSRIFSDIESGKIYDRSIDKSHREIDNEIKQRIAELGNRINDKQDFLEVRERLLEDYNHRVQQLYMAYKRADSAERRHKLYSDLKEAALDGDAKRKAFTSVYAQNVLEETLKSENRLGRESRLAESLSELKRGRYRLYNEHGDQLIIPGEYHDTWNAPEIQRIIKDNPLVDSEGNFKEDTANKGKLIVRYSAKDNNESSRSDKDGFSSTQKYSISEMQTETEPAGSLNRIKKSMSELGKIATEKNVEIRKKKERDIDNLNMLDMWVKTVRQVSKKNNAVKYFYNLARKAYDEQEKLRAHYGEAMKRFNQYTKDKKDLDDVSQALLQGDMEGKEYKVKDLKEMGLSDNAIRAYKLVRLRLGSAYKLINDARMQVIERNKILHSSQLDDFKKAHFLKDSDILSIINKGNGKILVTYRGAKIYEHTGEMVSPEALSKLKADKDVCVIDFEPVTDDLGTTLWRVDYTERPKPLTKLTGYVPHFFHKFMVYQKYTNEDGEEILVTRGSGRSLKEAAKLANGYAKENPDSEYVIRAQGFEYDEEYNNVVVGDRDFARMTSQIHKNTDMSLNEARKFLRESAGAKIKGRHRFFGNMKKRKGAEGFEKDVPWLLEHYFNASSRYVAMEHWKPQAISTYERWFGDFNAEPKTDIARYIKNHINDMNGVPSRFEKLLNKSLEKTALGQRLSDYYNGRPALALSSNFSSFIAVVKLGLGNFASAAINFMQFVNIGTKLNSYKWAMEGLKRALKPNKLDRRILKNSGVMNEITLADNSGGYSHNRDSGRVRNVLGNIKRAANKTMLPFTMADSLMRKAAILGAYYQGVTEKGMKPEPGKTISKKAMQYAKEVNFDANFDYSNVATPGVMRAGSVLTQQMFQFQKYPIMQLEFMWNNVVHAENNAQRARFLVPYMLLAGVAGALPFGDLLNEFFSFLFGIYTGKDENLADECKAAMMKWAGNDPASKKLVETVIYGIPALAGIDISGRVGMSGAFSGKYYGTAPSSAAGAIANALGGPVLGTAFNTIDQLHNGNPAEAIKAISPALGNMIQAWVNGASYGTHHRVNSVYEDGFAKVIHGLGFRSTDESNTSFINSYLYDMRSRYGDEKKDAMDAYRKDKTAENKRAMQDLGITDKQFKRYESDSNKSAQERAQKEWHTKKKPTAKEAQLLHDAKALKDFVQ